jgi:hypothetical protein
MNVVILSTSQWLDVISTKSMIAKHGDWVEDSPRKDYILSNQELWDTLKLIAIPTLIIITAYLAHKKLPHHQDKIIRGMFALNTLVISAVLINTALTRIEFEQLQLFVYQLVGNR